MFNKFELLSAITISMIGGIAIGYGKAREKCLEVILKATTQKKTDDKED